MAEAGLASRVDPIRVIVVRGSVGGAAFGTVLGGVLGSIEWPVVATFFGALAGAFLGAAAGAGDGLVLAALTRIGVGGDAHGSFRVASGAVWALAALPIMRAQHAVTALALPAGRIALVIVCGLFGAAAGAPVAVGVDDEDADSARQLSRAAVRCLLWGSVGGGLVGAVTGLVIGLRGYWPTAPIAAIEGAVLGAASGVVLAGVLGALVLGPRVRARR
jgi:hypothetical protein